MVRFVMSKFKKYMEQLKKLDSKDSLLDAYENSDKVLMFLSGSSNYETAALSKEQIEFLSIFKDYGYEIVMSNFPYNKSFPHKEYIDENLLKASYMTALYYIKTLKNIDFQKEIRKHLKKILNLKELVIITQSSGLNVLYRFLDTCDDNELKNSNIKVFALGPVAKKTKKMELINCTIIKGKYDEYSRLLDFHKTDLWLKCRHLDYLKNKELWSYVYEYLQKN